MIDIYTQSSRISHTCSIASAGLCLGPSTYSFCPFFILPLNIRAKARNLYPGSSSPLFGSREKKKMVVTKVVITGQERKKKHQLNQSVKKMAFGLTNESERRKRQ